MNTDLTLVSIPLCPYVQRAAIVLAEKSVPFERRYVDLAERPAWFTARPANVTLPRSATI